MDLAEIKFDDRGLVPAIAQDVNTKEVLMLAWMNRESIEVTLKEKKACYWSRSRQELWLKGATSGHLQHLKGIKYDCDGVGAISFCYNTYTKMPMGFVSDSVAYFQLRPPAKTEKRILGTKKLEFEYSSDLSDIFTCIPPIYNIL